MSNKYKRFLFPVLLLIPFIGYSQVAKKRWRAYRIEYIAGLGATNFLGELGGANQVGTHAFRDLEFSMTRPAAMVGFRYKLSPSFASCTKFSYGVVAGDDKLTKEHFRNNRNLSFRSNIFELSTNIEFSFLQEQVGHRYKLRGVRGMRNIELSAYGFVGIGVFHFNPKANLDGHWYQLQPLGTEGQGQVPSRDKYKRTQICVPLGLGAKYAIDRQISVGFELGLRYTFTDYIDDVSKSYYYERGGTLVEQLADRSLDDQSHVGQQRGDPRWNDAYIFAVFNVSYKIRTGRTNYPMF